jgi:ribosomal protein L12E/L44/L45/RPP1/RPP2
MLAEQESTKTLALLRRVAEKVGVKADDPAMESLIEDMEPNKLVEQIRSAAGSELETASANGSKPGRKKAAT